MSGLFDEIQRLVGRSPRRYPSHSIAEALRQYGCMALATPSRFIGTESGRTHLSDSQLTLARLVDVLAPVSTRIVRSLSWCLKKRFISMSMPSVFPSGKPATTLVDAFLAGRWLTKSCGRPSERRASNSGPLTCDYWSQGSDDEES